MEEKEKILELSGITKAFPGVLANDHVSFDVAKGEIHALLGENGAGKSTLMSVLFGLYEPDEGTIAYKGKETKISSPREATRLKIGMVHQHFRLVENFTVLENIVLGEEETRKGLLDLGKARGKVEALSREYKFAIEPDAIVRSITVGMQQRVEILKMLYRDCELLIFDEPTAVLVPQETEQLMSIMKGLAHSGKSIIFITHKLNEIKQIADRCTVLRKGRAIATVDVASATLEGLSEMMVGRKVSLHLEKKEASPSLPVLEVRGLTVYASGSQKPKLDNVSFEVRQGEIVCIAGVDGNGQSELVRAVTGLAKASSGSVWLSGRDITNAPVRERILSGMSHIPEDRQKDGLVLGYSLAENMVLETYFTDAFQRWGFLNFAAIRSHTQRLIDKYDIRSGQGASALAVSMSGGNQQKAIIARELDAGPQLLVAVQPTRGLDVGTIEFVHSQIIRLRDEGKAILLVTLELEEVAELSDRILVIFEGAIVAEYSSEGVDMAQLGLSMAGAKRERGDGLGNRLERGTPD
jgi:simple sugar transport system ATP-binding protein